MNFDDTNYDKDDPESVIHIRILAGHINLKNVKHLKIYKRRTNDCSVAS